jgi:hypothetical protein
MDEKKSKNLEEASGKSLLLTFRDNMDPESQKEFNYDDWRRFAHTYVQSKYKKRFLRYIDKADNTNHDLSKDIVFIKNIRRLAMIGFFDYMEGESKAVVRGLKNVDGTVRFGDVDAE